MSTSVKIGWRLLMIAALSAAALYIAVNTWFWLVSVWLTLAILYLIYSVIRLHRRSERDLDNFLLSLRQLDYNSTLPSHIPEEYPERAASYETISHAFREISLSRESSRTFSEMLVEQVGVALIGYQTENEQIILSNKTAREVLGTEHLPSLDILEKTHPDLAALLRQMKAGDRSMISIKRENEQLHLSLTTSLFVSQDMEYKLFSLQNIRSELEARETESWIRLVNVLTHEIKNSAIPVATLSEAVQQLVVLPGSENEPRAISSLTQQEWSDLREGLGTIARRSRRLAEFVEKYSRLTRLPAPDKSSVNLGDLLHSVKEILQPELDKRNISCMVEEDKHVTARIDLVQIEQVLINLVKNAVEVVNSGEGEIKLEVWETDLKAKIKVSDNGPGIPVDELEQVFVPFFTTKENGTGLGLSVSRQVILAHKGQITVASEPGKTEFEITLPLA